MRRPSPRTSKALAAVVLVAGLVLAWWWAGGDHAAAPALALGDASTRSSIPGQSGSVMDATAPSGPGNGASVVLSPKGQQEHQQRLLLAQQRYERAAEVYNAYRDSTRYPHQSRPLSEHPDQVRPFDPVEETLPFKDGQGRAVKGLRLRTSQDRVFVSGTESVVLSVAAVDDNNQPQPLQVSRAQAQSVPDTTAPIQLISADVSFRDDGAPPDSRSGDGVYTARFTPATQGYAQQSGTIRVLVYVGSAGESGVVQFDLVYAAGTAGQWTGVREAVENGSLNFYLKARVSEAGRYVASARVFDAENRPFALLQFNDELKAGAVELRMHVFGALIRDKNPAFPLRLVDVEGFLLRENTFPDRALLPRQPGVVHTSQRYSANQFSPQEWSSEERERYLREYGKDLQSAQDALKALQ